MRRAIVVACTEDGRTVPRLFMMSHSQAIIFQDVLRQTPGEARDAEIALERTVVRIMAGTRKPGEQDHPVFARLAAAFPRLSDQRIQALPRAGCPEGWIECVVMQLQTPAGPRAICYQMSTEQQRVFNNAIVAVQGMSECTRDDAWLGVQKMVGRLLGGARPKDDAEPVLVDLAAAFPEEDLIGILRDNRVADEQDVARWSFTRAPKEIP